MSVNPELPMPTIAWEEATRAELFARSDLPAPAQKCRENIASRLEGLVTDDVLASFAVTSWAKRVPLAGEDPVAGFERRLYERFLAWARDAGVRLSPFFDTRECYSAVTGDRQTELVLPAACLALYDANDELVAVVPHGDGPRSVSIRECLNRLADETTDDDRTTTLLTTD